MISTPNDSKILFRNFKWSCLNLKTAHAGSTIAVDIRLPSSAKTEDNYKVKADRIRVFTRDFTQTQIGNPTAVRGRTNGYSSHFYATRNGEKRTTLNAQRYFENCCNQHILVKMGGPPCQIEPCADPDWKDNTELWNILSIGGFTNFVERVQGHDQSISVRFAKEWNERMVDYGGQKILINDELIAEATGLSLEGYRFFNKRVIKEAEERRFVEEEEKLIFNTAGLLVNSIPSPYDEVTRMMIRYISLEGRFVTVPAKHLVFLNHFRRSRLVCFPHYLLNSLERSILEFQKHTRAVPLHQGLILLIHKHCLIKFPGLPSSPGLALLGSVAASPVSPAVPAAAPASGADAPMQAAHASPSFPPAAAPATHTVSTSKRVTRASRRLNLESTAEGDEPLDDIARDLLNISSASPQAAPTDNPSRRLEALEAELKLLKDEVKNLAKQKGKKSIEGEGSIGNSQLDEIYKKLTSLDSRLGKTKTRHEYNIAAFRAIEEFIEGHARSVSHLSGVPMTLWGNEKESKRTREELDKTDAAHMTTLGMYHAWKKVKMSIDQAAKK
ncbi:hypothetical protein KI387_041509 [Taxus chinensis]|uniref:Uncharacterized protein n=2 Tax=Taxus chinensis TaxID=29808 RepID=A0AA38C3T6_TAXCH|nr:hypothetical protein KI387_041509 [Taxus chinensis]